MIERLKTSRVSRSGRGRLARAAWLALASLALCASAARSDPAAIPGTALILPEHYARSIAALGFPGARRAFQIGSGSQVSGGDAALTWRLASASGAVRTSPVCFERDGVPVAHWWMVSERESVTFEAAAAPNPALGDSSLELTVLATVVWRASEPGESVLEVRVRPEPDGPHVAPWDALDDHGRSGEWKDGIACRDGRMLAAPRAGCVPVTRARGAGRRTGISHADAGELVTESRARMKSGEHRSCEFWMPLYPLAASTTPISGRSHREVVERARRLWREWMARTAPLATPDSLVNAAWRAALVTLIQCQERDEGGWVPIGNPFQYRDVWLRDGARVVRALAVAGLTDLARDDARTLARFALPTGALLSQRGQLDGTGEALWAFEQACALPPDREAARRFLPHAALALDWIERQRRVTRSLGLAWPGLLPFCDPHDAEVARAQLVGNDAWCFAACRAAAALARIGGDAPLERRALDAARDLRDTFDRALARTRSLDVPPSWQGVGLDWGNAATGYPTGVIPPDAPRLEALARRMWGAAGRAGLASYGRADLLHTYLGADLAQNALLAGRPGDARDYLRALLAHSSSTLGQAEVFEREGGEFGENLPPHATAAATLVDLMRNMIVCDWRDTLEVALGGGLSWWGGTRFENAPTRFGRVTVALDRPSPDRLHVSWTPVAVLTRVRVPDGARAVSALTPGARLVEGRWIECAPGTSEAIVQVAIERAGNIR